MRQARALSSNSTATIGRRPPSRADGESLWERVVDLGLEGIVAKKRSGRYLLGRRGWIKTNNRDYWRYAAELEGVERGIKRIA